MQSSLLWLLLFCLVMAAISYYLGFVRPPVVLAWLSQASFITLLFLLIPVLLYVLNQQRGAVGRLEQAGFSGPPVKVESVGFGNGIGEKPTWLFEAEGEAMGILDFYRSPDSRSEWELTADGGQMLVFKRGGEAMTVTGISRNSATSLMFNLDRKEVQ
jgi:hypothetical protein